MLSINLSSRFSNKAFLLSMVSAIVLLLQQLGFAYLIPSDYSGIINTVLVILSMLGIVVDTSTTGISDKVTAVVEPITDVCVATSDIISDVQAPVLEDNSALILENAELKAKVESITAALNPTV